MTTLDLPGLDREGVEVITGNILKGGYLDMPGVKGKGEAVLFMLVNEALHGWPKSLRMRRKIRRHAEMSHRRDRRDRGG